jgi:hypothetical protein
VSGEDRDAPVGGIAVVVVVDDQGLARERDTVQCRHTCECFAVLVDMDGPALMARGVGLHQEPVRRGLAVPGAVGQGPGAGVGRGRPLRRAVGGVARVEGAVADAAVLRAGALGHEDGVAEHGDERGVLVAPDLLAGVEVECDGVPAAGPVVVALVHVLGDDDDLARHADLGTERLPVVVPDFMAVAL